MSDVTYEEMFSKAPYFGQDMVMRATLAQVLTRVPESVREFVLGKCVITSSVEPRFGGIVWKAQVPKQALDSPHEFWLIVLSELAWSAGMDMVRRKGLKEVAKSQNERWRHIIAHEIAHAYLGHDRMNPDLPEDTEAEADRLAARWGFANSDARTTRLR